MTLDTSPETARPPVFLGCFFAVAAIVLAVSIGVFFVKFLDSGANDGKVRLDVPEAYAPGSIEFVGQSNFYLVRLLDGTFIALSDLDAANRANQARRCRVAPTAVNDPSLGIKADALAARMSPRVVGSSTVLRETCNNAIYDIAGANLAGSGANLDTFAIRTGADGHLLVDTSRRVCTTRNSGADFAPRNCSAIE